MTATPSGTAALPLGAGHVRSRAARLPAHAGPDHGVLGRVGVHRGRAGARHPSPAGKSAVRHPGPRLRPAAAGRVVRGADQPVRGGDERRGGGFWFLVAERWLRGIVPNRWARYGAAIGGVLVGATSWTVWNQSVVNEKVYTVSLLSIALVMWLVVRWGDDEPGPHRDRWLVLIAYVLALTATNHLMGFLALPALGIYVLWTDWRVAVQPWADRDVLRSAPGGHRQVARHVHRRRPDRAGAHPADPRRGGLRAVALAQGSAGLPGRPRGRGGDLAQLPVAPAPRGPVSGDQ